MTVQHDSPELRLLASTVRGPALFFGPPDLSLPGAENGHFTPSSPGAEAAEYPDGRLDVPTASVESIQVMFDLECARDPLVVLREWRRVLRPQGAMVLVLRAPECGPTDGERQSFTPSYVVSLLNNVGGFQVESLDEVEPGKSFAVWTTRHAVAEVRMPLGSLAPAVAAAARSAVQTRAELCFQVGAMLLQAEEPALAEQCFLRAQDLERTDAECLFAIGMSRYCQRRYSEALTDLQKALTLRPKDPEVRRWVELARRARAAEPSAPTVGVPS